jgi:hypothetical protein
LIPSIWRFSQSDNAAGLPALATSAATYRLTANSAVRLTPPPRRLATIPVRAGVAQLVERLLPKTTRLQRSASCTESPQECIELCALKHLQP